MAQNITLLGANYSAVPAVTLPKTGGGTATFTDVTDTTAAAADVASGKYFYTASGVRTQGTNSGGGGDNSFIVMLSWDDVDELWTPDKTVEEIQNAYTSGKEIAFICQETFNPAYWYYDDDYVFVYGVYVASEIPNQFLQKEYLYNTYGVTSLGDLVLLYPNFEYPTRTYTPTEVQQVDTITHNSSDYNGIEEVSVTVNAIPSNYVGSGITRRSSSDLTASGATVSVPSGYYQSNSSKVVASGTAGTPTATKGAVSNHSVSITPSVTNTTGYITGSTKTGTAVTVSASELVSGSETKTENGTYDVTNLAEIVVDVQGGGGSGIQVESVWQSSSTSSSVVFSGLKGNPTSFAIYIDGDGITPSATPMTDVIVFDGTNLHGQTIVSGTNAVVYDDTSYSKSYSNGTLTITSASKAFNTNYGYIMSYSYGGSASNIGTKDVQVGSGATSITFTGLTHEPLYWSCIFKGNFGTSSGYQRVIFVNKVGNIYGHCMDSATRESSSYWTASYSGGDLTITSQGTNTGGYFHQPGYYQLTYAIDESAPSYQTKTVTPTTSQQVVQADSGYDALEEVIVNAMPSMTLPSSTSVASSGTSKATISASSSTQYLNIPTGYNATAQYYTISASGGGSSKNVQVLQSTSRTNSSSLTKVLGDLTVSKTGTYDIYWSGGRSNTSTSYTWGTRLYVDGTGYGTENTSWTNNVQSNHLSNVSLTANQKLSVYARGRTGSYYTFAPMLVIVEN